MRTILLVAAANLIATVAVSYDDVPVPQVTFRGRVVEVYDGDTMTVEITVRARVRLLDCWAPEIRGGTDAERRRGLASRDFMKCLSLGRPCVLHVPLAEFDRLEEAFSFGCTFRNSVNMKA